MKFEFRLNVALSLQTVCYRIRYKIIKNSNWNRILVDYMA
jgi:hypothetical protein